MQQQKQQPLADSGPHPSSHILSPSHPPPSTLIPFFFSFHPHHRVGGFGDHNVGQAGILSAGAEQNCMGGSGAVPEPDAGGLRSVRLGVVSVFFSCAHTGRWRAGGGARLRGNNIYRRHQTDDGSVSGGSCLCRCFGCWFHSFFSL